MDLSNIDLEKGAEKGAFLHLEDPRNFEKLYTEDGKAIGFDVVGTDSARYRRAQARIINSKMGKRQKNQTIEKIRQENAGLLAECVVKCHHIEFEGQTVKPEDVERLLIARPWILEQLDEFVADRSNFFLTA